MNKPVEPIVVQAPDETGVEQELLPSPLSFPSLRSSLANLGDFRVRLVRNEEQLGKAIDIRVAAYARHFPDFAALLAKGEASDRHPDSIVILAETRGTNRAEGTVRIQTNLHEQSDFERDLVLPDKYKNTTIAHVSRLGVRQGRGATSVKIALFKSLYRYCLATQIRWLMVGARVPMDKQYEALGFEDVFSKDVMMEVPKGSGIPLRIMSFEVSTAERRWREINHPFYNYMFVQYTPDIEIFSSVSGMWTTPRRRNRGAEAWRTSDELGIPLV